MKQNPGQNTKHNKLPNQKPRPEIRDDLDSREGEEQLTKGNDTTHNKRETKKEHLKKKS